MVSVSDSFIKLSKIFDPLLCFFFINASSIIVESKTSLFCFFHYQLNLAVFAHGFCFFLFCCFNYFFAVSTGSSAFSDFSIEFDWFFLQKRQLCSFLFIKGMVQDLFFTC